MIKIWLSVKTGNRMDDTDDSSPRLHHHGLHTADGERGDGTEGAQERAVLLIFFFRVTSIIFLKNVSKERNTLASVAVTSRWYANRWFSTLSL